MKSEPNERLLEDHGQLKISLRWLLIIAFVIQGIGIVGLTGWLAFRNSKASTNRLISEIQADTAHNVEHELDRLLETADTLNELTVNYIQARQLDLTDIRTLDNIYWSHITTFESIYGLGGGNTKGETMVFFRPQASGEDEAKIYHQEYNSLEKPEEYTRLKLSAEREIVASVTSGRSMALMNRSWHKTALDADESTWTSVYSSLAESNETAVLLNRDRPVFDEQDQLQGVVSTILSVDRLDQFLNSLEISPSGTVYILQADGKLVSHSADEGSIQSSIAYLNQASGNNLASIQQAQQFEFFVDGQRQFLQVNPICGQSELDWLVVTVMPEADFLEQIHANHRNILYLCMGALGIAGALGAIISHWLVRPINRLSQAATHLSAGNFDWPRKGWHSVTEVNVLAQSLSRMERDLQQSFKDLQASEHRFRRAIADAPFPIMIHAEDGEVLEINEAWTESTGYTHADIPTVQTWTERAYGDRSTVVLNDIFPKLYDLDARFNEGEFIVTTKVGSQRIWKFSSAPLAFCEERRVVISMAVDITESYQAEIALRESESRFRQLADGIHEIFYLVDLTYSEMLYINPAYETIWGRSCQSLYEDPRSFLEAIHPDDRPHVDVSLSQHQQGRATNLAYRIIQPDGTIRWVSDRGFPVFDTAGQPYRISGVVTDITERKQAEAALKQSEERLRLVTENMNDLVCLHKPDGRYLYVTPSSQALLGYRPEELIGEDPYELFHPEDSDRIRQGSHQRSLSGQQTAVTYRLRQKSGAYVWLETLTQPICNAAGEVIHIQTTSRNVSDRVQVESQLRHDALHDRLTELPNRSLLMARLSLALKRAKRYPQKQFAVLFLDLDHFKVINDSLGHLVGDELLLNVSQQLIHLTRQVDLVARLGGDEFVILIEEIDDTAEVLMVAERILSVLKTPIKLSDREVFIDVSIGIVFGDADHHQPEDLLRDADLAMYRAKHRGRGQYALFEPKMRLQIINRLHTENDLRQALDNDELVLHYQPILDLKTMRIKGFEALVRWQHPKRGLVSPGDFIEIAEETGLIVPIGQWILNTACEQLANWQTQFPDWPLSLSVNLSVQQLQEDLLQKLRDIPAFGLLKSNSLTLEITESMLVQNVASTQRLLNRIRAMGIHLSIDDFGTGYSCLSYLHQLPADALKIDRAFISPSAPDDRNRAIAESILALAHQLGLDAIAEGIETPQQLAWLKQLGCECGQGLLFAPAYSATRATKLLIDASSTVAAAGVRQSSE